MHGVCMFIDINRIYRRYILNTLICFFIDACEPGYWSADGTPVCSLCPIGTFSNSFGLTNCTQCKHSRSTEIEGAVDESFCQGVWKFFCDKITNNFLDEGSLSLCFSFPSEFDLWLTDRTSMAYTQFHTQMSYNVFLTSLWFQKDNSSEIFIISVKNARNESEIEIWINTNISLSTKRWDKLVLIISGKIF